MAMSEEAFDAAMAAASNVYGDSTLSNGFSSKTEEKRASLFDKTSDKRANILGEATPIRVQSIPDGDGYIPMGGSKDDERRMVGYDAYEVNHENDLELMKEQGFQNHLARQRLQISKEKNIPYSQVTNEDIYELGNRDKLNNLYEMVRKPGDAPWTPGPTTSDPLTLGSAENPLDIAIRERQEGTGTHGRTLASAFNPDTAENVNEQMYSDSNALHFKNQKNKNGKYIPDTERMELQNAATFLNDKLEAGKTPTPEEVAAFQQSNNMSRGSQEENRIAAMYDRPASVDQDGRLLSNILGIGAGALNIGQNIMDTGAEKVAWAGEKVGLWDEEYKKAIGEVHDSTLEGWQKTLNVNTEHTDQANQELVSNIENGNYIDAALSVVKNIDVHLAQSAPEMGAMALKVPGLIAAVSSRVQDMSKGFTKDRGREPTAAEEAGMWATAAAVLIPEKFLLIGPLKSIFNASKGAAKAGGKAKGFMNKMNQMSNKLDNLIPKSKTLGGSMKAIGVTAAGEVIQEIADQAQETYWKENRLITGNEAIASGIAGGVMGGVIKTTAETKGLSKNLQETRRRFDLKANVANMSEEDIALRNADADTLIEEGESNVVNLEKAHDEVGSAKSFDDLLESKNNDIKAKAERKAMELTAEDTFYEKKEVQDEMKGNISNLNPKRRKRVSKDLELTENATNAEILEAATKAGKNAPPLVLQEDIKKEIASKILVDNFESTKTEMQESFIIQSGIISNKIKSDKKQKAELNETRTSQKKKGNVSERKSGEIDTSSETLKDKDYTGSRTKKVGNLILDGLLSIAGKNSVSNNKIKAELNKYDNASIRKAMKSAGENSNIKAQGQKILNKRKKADNFKKEEASLSDFTFERGKGSKSLNFQKLKKLVSKKEIENQDEKDYIHKAINAMEKRKDINRTQAVILRKRLNVNKVGSKKSTPESKNKKLFRDSNDIKAEIEVLNKVKAKLEKEGTKEGINDGKIGTINETISDLNSELEKELQYEEDNNIKPEPVVKAKEETKPEPESEVEPESKEETKEESEVEEETKEPEEAPEESKTAGEPKDKKSKAAQVSDLEQQFQDREISDGYEVGEEFDILELINTEC